MSLRLDPLPHEWIDRSRPLCFRFEGEAYQGYAGDTVTSALWAAGERVLGRSFKYHRPRGILSGANHDANLVVQDGVRLNLRADVEPLQEGMDLVAVNTQGGVKHDRLAVMGRFSRFMPAGFYYKAFYRPRALFPIWERAIRRQAGLGELHLDSGPVPSIKRHEFCDVLVVGAGASGMAAALVAAEAGADVVLVDENSRPGGSAFYCRGGELSPSVLENADAVASHPRIRLRTKTVAVGWYADHWVPLWDEHGVVRLRTRAVIVASGCHEQPAVFSNNDLPGVMLAGAAQRLLWRYAVKPAAETLVLAANSDAYRAALDLLAAGVPVKAVIDQRRTGEPGSCADVLRAKGVRLVPGACVYEALPDAADGGLGAVRVCPLSGGLEPDLSRSETIVTRGLLVGVGYAPAAALLHQAGARLRYSEATGQFMPLSLPHGVFACGRVNGVHALAARIADGERAGRAATVALGLSGQPVAVELSAPEPMSHPWPVVAHPLGKNFVDFDEDLQLRDFETAAQEGFDSIELLKRFTTVGMGPSQGKHANMNAVRILAQLRGEPVDAVGTTTARPFYHPVPLAHLAGRAFHPERRTPMDGLHEEAGAVWMPAGMWRRPAYYRIEGLSAQDCIEQEVRAVRENAGIIDVGTLGKIEAYGPQAAQFLERVYACRVSNLKIGATRYGLMLDEAGVIIDDGVIVRLAEEHFYFTTTTTSSTAVFRELNRLNAMWRMELGLANLTGAYTAVNLAGPNSRRVLKKLSGLDLSQAAFPYLGAREAEVASIPARLLRVGFVGELGYEIHVPAERGAQLWLALLDAGQALGLRPFGVEAQRVLRLEKGHLIVGQDSDGLTTPLDADCMWAVKMDKPFFIGQRSLRVVSSRPRKQRLVGFALAKDLAGPLPKECHLIIESNEILGRVTSIAVSRALGHAVGLAMVAPHRAQLGTRLSIRVDGGQMVEAEVVATPFYDAGGERQKLENAA